MIRQNWKAVTEWLPAQFAYLKNILKEWRRRHAANLKFLSRLHTDETNFEAIAASSADRCLIKILVKQTFFGSAQRASLQITIYLSTYKQNVISIIFALNFEVEQ